MLGKLNGQSWCHGRNCILGEFSTGLCTRVGKGDGAQKNHPSWIKTFLRSAAPGRPHLTSALRDIPGSAAWGQVRGFLWGRGPSECLLHLCYHPYDDTWQQPAVNSTKLGWVRALFYVQNVSHSWRFLRGAAGTACAEPACSFQGTRLVQISSHAFPQCVDKQQHMKKR